MSYLPMTTEIVSFKAHNGDKGEAYYARPTGDGPFGGVVLIHHMPGWDDWCIEAARKLAHKGFAVVAPHLYFREQPGSPDDCAARARAAGGVSDDQMIGDLEGAASFLRAQSHSNGKVAVMGFCSGGRQAYLAGCRMDNLDAIVDCWGGRVVVDDPADLTPQHPVAPIDLTKNITAPMLGLFGNDDQRPNPDQVNRTEEKLKEFGKTYEFHRYDGAGHGFFGAERPGYRVEQANDGWRKVYAFLDKTIGPAATLA
jgi:carboxymethylenebutenolidase